MGRIGSTEMNLIWENFGITEMCSGLIDITGSKNIRFNFFGPSMTQKNQFWGKNIHI